MGESFGKYELLQRLATGGMGEVFLARHSGIEGFEKLLVVKRILPHLVEDEEFIGMFLDEARIAARLNHPNIAQIFDVGEVKGSYFIAMEYVHGEDVRRASRAADKKGKPISVPLACRIAADAAAGLDFAHKLRDPGGQLLGLIHRDVSPHNLLVTFEGGVKLIDFGVAKAAGRSSHTVTGAIKGKYSYMSPEQAEGGQLDCRSDVFALGVVLYELATQSRLFKRESETQTLQAVKECRVRPPSEISQQVPVSLDGLLMRALAPKPADRFSDAAEMRLALEDWLVQERAPASTAHLAAFMQQVYLERLDEERRLGHVLGAEPTPAASDGRNARSDAGTAVARKGSSTGRSHRVAPPAREPEPPRAPRRQPEAPPPARPDPVAAAPEDDEPTNPELRSLRRAGILLGLSVLLAAGGAVSIYAALRSQPALSGALDPLSRGLSRFVDGLKRREPQRVSLSLESDPPDAVITLGGKTLGRTPMSYQAERSNSLLSLRFSAPGYVAAQRLVRPNADSKVKVMLAREKPKAPAPDKPASDDQTADR